MLSARTLAASLATQENPEKGLCPYEPVPLLEELEIGFFRDENDKLHRNSKPLGAGKFTSPRSYPEQVSGNYRSGIQRQKPKTECQNGNLVKSGPQAEIADKNANEISFSKTAQKEKDPKSFTQNLFDTEAMKFLHLAKIRESFSRWAPWLRKEESSTSPHSQCNVGVVGKKTNARAKEDESHPSHSGKPESFINVQGQIEELATVTPRLDQCPEPRSDAYRDCQSFNHGQIASPSNLESTSVVSDCLSMSQTIDDVVLQDQSSDENDADEIKSNYYNLSLALRTKQICTSKDAGKTQTQIACINPQGAASRATEIISDDHATIPADPYPEPVELPQALGRFTLENISALVDTVKIVHPGPGDGYGFLQSLGRATTISRVSRFVGGTATQPEMNIAFATQSIIYVLSTIDALLMSFVTSKDVTSSDYKQSVKSGEITQAFRLLMEIDHHPRNIFPSLWISVGKLHPPISLRSKGALLKACRSTKFDRPLLSSTSNNQSFNSDILDNVDAAHVVKIALAALVASIPECNLDTWASVRSLRASGRIAPSFNGSHAGTKPMDLLFEVMDSFDDELALSLMVRVVRAVAARQCLFEISRLQGPSAKDSHSAKSNEGFMDVLLQEIIDSDILDTTSTQSGAVSTIVDSKATAHFMQNQKDIQKPVTSRNFYLSVLVEWLRSVVFSEWDGKAEISRWGPVGGALEFMSHLCKSNRIQKEYSSFRTLLTLF